jgi:hypothetical protein
MPPKTGKMIVMNRTSGAIYDEHAAGAALRGRLLRDQFLRKVVIEVGDAEIGHRRCPTVM